jgi:hypothetical protein
VALSVKAASDLIVDQLFPAWQTEYERLERIDRWYRWKHEDLRLPRSATAELRALAELSKTPWLSLVVSALSQCLYVDGYRSPLDEISSNLDQPPDTPTEPSGPWKTWNANQMDRRQIAIHRAALAYGYSFSNVMPSDGPRSVIRGVSPRKMYAAYEDPAEDDWPRYVLRADSLGEGKGWKLRLYDDVDVLTFHMDSSTSKPAYGKREEHRAGVTPFVRYANNLDLDGRCDGEVEPHIPLAGRINKTAYDRLLTQHFASWKIRTVSGMAEPDTEEAANRKKLQLRQDDLLVAEDPDTKFGTLDETPLGGFIESWRADIEALAAVSQTPTHALTGQLVNLSADALAASRAGLTQKIAERQKAFGASHVQTLRLSAALEGDEAYANDMLARVTWQDMEIRSLSQAVDALGKAATMLGIPLPALWQRIPGVEKSDVDEWRRMVAEADPLDRLTAELARQSTQDNGSDGVRRATD